MMLINKRSGFAALAGLSATSLFAAQPPNAGSVLTDGFYNTAMGNASLSHDTTPSKACVPYLFNSTANYMSGCANTATGFAALDANTTGYENTGDGAGALFRNTSGAYNTAVGTLALFNTDGTFSNTALGADALFANTTGSFNSSLRSYSLTANTTGAYNTASGFIALNSNTTGSNNTAIGYGAGAGLTTGSYNLYLGAGVSALTATDSYVTVIGAANPAAKTYVAGITSSPIIGAAVYVTSSGQLGVLASSERYKTDIRTLDAAGEKLLDLRPVSFHLKTQPEGAIQYGLIAEEVDRIYPELVIRDNKGVIQGVRYDELAPMLLRRAQLQQAEIIEEHGQVATLVAQHEADAARIASLEQKVADVDALKLQLAALVEELHPRDQRVAQR